MLIVGKSIRIGEDEIEERFIRSSGPGGQNVNKLATAVQLRFDVRHSLSLPQDVRERLEKIAARRLTKYGVLVITAQRFRTQERNRQDARGRLIELIERAAISPRLRKPTRPTEASRVKHREQKAKRSRLKTQRTRPTLDE